MTENDRCLVMVREIRIVLTSSWRGIVLSPFHGPRTGCKRSVHGGCAANNRARVGGNGGLKVGRVVLV